MDGLACDNAIPQRQPFFAMAIDKDAYRRFQEELAALDKDQQRRLAEASEAPMERARREFLALRDRYGLTVADVVAFFPEEDGIAYLQALIAAREAPTTARKPRAKRQSSEGG